MGRQAEFRYPTGRTLVAHQRPTDRSTGTINGVESGTVPGLYLFDGLLFSEYEIREGTLAVGQIPAVPIQSSLPGQVAWPVKDKAENGTGLPASAWGVRKPLSVLSRLRLQTEFAQLNPYGVTAEEVGVDDNRLDWFIGFLVPIDFQPRTIRLLMINSGKLALRVQTYISGSSFQTIAEIQPKLDPCVVEVPVLPNAVDGNGYAWVRINAPGTIVDLTDAQFDLDTAWLLSDMAGGAGETPVFPAESDVRLGVIYGYPSSPLTGTYDPMGGSVPSPNDVRFGVATGNEVGNLQLPVETQVLIGVGYGSLGTEFTGMLEVGAGGDLGNPVSSNGQIPGPLKIGDTYTVDEGDAFVWTIPELAGYSTDAGIWFEGGCKESTDVAWSTKGTISGSGTWTVTVEMFNADTSPIPAGDHSWSLYIAQIEVKTCNFSFATSGNNYTINPDEQPEYLTCDPADPDRWFTNELGVTGTTGNHEISLEWNMQSRRWRLDTTNLPTASDKLVVEFEGELETPNSYSDGEININTLVGQYRKTTIVNGEVEWVAA